MIKFNVKSIEIWFIDFGRMVIGRRINFRDGGGFILVRFCDGSYIRSKQQLDTSEFNEQLVYNQE